MLKRALVYGLPALALFVCIWVTRVFLAVDIVSLFMPMAGLPAIAAVAVVGGLLPSVPLGIAYGLIGPRPIVSTAFTVAVIACLLELAFASLTVPWWSFVTWWVLPVECVIVLAMFPAAAWIGSHLFARSDAIVRRRTGVGVFVLLPLGAIAWPWLHGCIRSGACGIGA